MIFAEEGNVKGAAPTAPTPETKLYGFIFFYGNYADKAVMSFGKENFNGVTAVKRQVNASDSNSRWGFSPYATRIGFEHSLDKKMKGVAEIDFIDFDQSQGNVSVRPRLRQLFLSYKPADQFEIFAGQMWDIFAPLKPHTFNLIGKLFQQGDLGWQREQLGFKYSPFQSLELSLALGVTGKNTNSYPVIDVEFNSTPTLGTQVKFTPIANMDFYASFLVTNLKYRQSGIDSTRDNTYLDYNLNTLYNVNMLPYNSAPQSAASGGAALGMDLNFLDKRLNLRTEMNYGRNTANLNSLGLSKIQSSTFKEYYSSSRYGFITSNGSFAKDLMSSNTLNFYSIEEEGGWFSVNYKITESFSSGFYVSGAKILNTEHLQAADYNSLYYSQKFGTNLDFKKAGAIRENDTVALFLSYSPESRITFFLQGDYMKTYYKDPDRYRGLRAYIDSYDLDTNTWKFRTPIPFAQKSSAVAVARLLHYGVSYSF